MSSEPRERDDRILVLAPAGRESDIVATVLDKAGLGIDVCADLDDLTTKVDAGAGAVLIAEEALVPPGVWSFGEAIRRQPTWSDLPLVVLTAGEGDDADSATSALRVIEAMGNVTLLERPVRVPTLLSAIHSALRARRRQYEVRDHLEERKLAEAERERLLARERAARA